MCIYIYVCIHWNIPNLSQPREITEASAPGGACLPCRKPKRPPGTKATSGGFHGNLWEIHGKSMENIRGTPSYHPFLDRIYGNGGTVPFNHPFLDGIFTNKSHPFWGTPIYGKPQMWVSQLGCLIS